MEQFLNELQLMFDEGIMPTLAALLLGLVSLVLTVAKNKLVKTLSDRTNEIYALESKVKSLEEKLDNKIDKVSEAIDNDIKVNENSNQIISAVIDMLHVAYVNSKLNVDSKINLQKLYDKCPDALCDEVDKLIKVIEDTPTDSQIETVEQSTPQSYADIIASKIEQEC